VFTNPIKSGAVFIYPTDTIYGIGCNAIVEKAAQRIRSIKNRYTRPFSVIAPSVDWIREHCIVDEQIEEWLDQLPGPYTLILNLKTTDLISKQVNPDDDTIGVRIPDHWFSGVVKQIGYPIVTTSANHVGGNFMTSLDDLASDIRQQVDFVVYEGELQGRPSKIVNLTSASVEVKER
jgi:L-threonylcarbamoyladenylate synthase